MFDAAMSRLSLEQRKSLKNKKLAATMLHWQNITCAIKWWFDLLMALVRIRNERRALSKRYIMNFVGNMENLREPIYLREDYCFHLIRMDRHSFITLCEMLKNDGGLKDTKNMLIDEQVAVVFHVFAHHCKNRIVRIILKRYAKSVSRAVKNVTNAIINLQGHLLKKPEPIPEILPNGRRWRNWKSFKKCLGALDGTYIRVWVATEDKARYRSCRSEIATNVLAVCSPNMEFIYVLSGWEGSTVDSRILKDAISRMHGLKVPRGYCYLVDAGYTNCEGFLTPYRGQRYHLNEWRSGYQPTNAGMLSLHNFIRREMSYDPLEAELTVEEAENVNCDDNVAVIETTPEWSAWRDSLASQMFNEWNMN